MLKVDSVRVRYGAIEAVRGATLEVGEGEVVALVGPNGAGKTSLLSAIVGLVPPASGAIEFEGRDLTRMRTEDIIASGVGVVPEHRRLFGDLTVRENLLLGASSRRDRSGIADDLATVHDHFPVLKDRSGQRAGLLSGGEAQQVALGRALMGRPRLLLLDEPSLGLAPIVVDRVFEMLQRLKDEGLTMLLVEQNAFKALELADRAYVLRSGEISEGRLAREVAEDQDLVSAYLAPSSRT